MALREQVNDLYEKAWLPLRNHFTPVIKLIEKQRTGSKVHKKYDTPATPRARLLACAKVSEDIKTQLRAIRAALDPMDLAADIEARLGRIFAIVKRIEEDRQDEMERAGEFPQNRPRGSGLRCVSGRYRSLRLHCVRTHGNPCQIHPKEPKPTQALGVMNPDATTYPLRCHLSLAQYGLILSARPAPSTPTSTDPGASSSSAGCPFLASNPQRSQPAPASGSFLMKHLRRLLFAQLVFALCPVAQAATPTAVRAADRPIRVLIVDGFSNHAWQLNTALILGMLQATHLFSVDVSTAPPTKDAPGWDTWRPKFSAYDVVIQTCNDINGGPSWPREVQVALEDFVAHGGGLYIWHSGNNAFSTWPAYNDMIGLGWRKKEFGPAFAVGADEQLITIPVGEGQNTGHGARLDTVVHRLGDHPIHAGLPRAWKTPDIEVYHYARGPAKNLTILSYGFDPHTKMNWPLEWVVAYGEGRVYTSTFGHVWKGDTQPERMRCAGVQTIVIRSLQWLARRDVTCPVPADFPTAEKISVRGEIPLPAPAAKQAPLQPAAIPQI